ncbi:MAG: hypothetical protein Q8P55_00570 [bacterium]|nr:hypothetical protein [bacterium]
MQKLASLQKTRVQRLRRAGFSFSQIAKRLKIEKGGSLSMWSKDIKLTPAQRTRLKKREISGEIKGSKRAKAKRAGSRIIETAFLRKKSIKEIGVLTERDLFILGVGMYWSEGYTYPGGEQVGFTNSDPKLILLILKWFKEICKISKERITLHIKVNKLHQKRIPEIESYWSKLTRIPFHQFTKTTIIKTKPNKIYPHPETYMGTLRITVKQGTSLRRKIHGWIEGLIRNT